MTTLNIWVPILFEIKINAIKCISLYNVFLHYILEMQLVKITTMCMVLLGVKSVLFPF